MKITQSSTISSQKTANYCYILRTIAHPNPGIIFAKGNIKHPAKAVCNCSVVSGHVYQSLVAISQSVDMAKIWAQQMPDQANEMLHLTRQQAVDTVSDLRRLAECGHYGLIGIQEWVHQIGGTLSIDSHPEHGTTLTIHIPTAQPAQPQNTVRDPVCSAIIHPQQAYASTTYDNKRYFFCCPICQGAFQKEPERYVPSERYTDVANEPAV